MWSRAAHAAATRKKEENMSSNEETDRDKREPEAEDVVAHRYVADEAGEDDPEKRKKRHQSESPEGDDFGKRKR